MNSSMNSVLWRISWNHGWIPINEFTYEIFVNSTGTKACVTAGDLSDSDGNLRCFTRLLSSCDIKISLVSQCRILVAVQYHSIWIRSCSIFFTYWQLAPAGLLSDLVAAGADWRRLNLLADGRRTSPETQHKFETDSDIGHWHTLHRSYTAYKQYTAGCAWCINDGRTAASSAAVSWRHLLPTRFQENAQSEQHWNSDADIEGFICRKVKIINECTSRSNMPY